MINGGGEVAVFTAAVLIGSREDMEITFAHDVLKSLNLNLKFVALPRFILGEAVHIALKWLFASEEGVGDIRAVQ